MYLQNKPDNNGGAPVASLMAKLGQGILRVKKSVIFFVKECRIFLIVISPPFMGKEDDLISMESG